MELCLCRRFSELVSGSGEGESSNGDTILEDSIGDGSATGLQKSESETEMESDPPLNPVPQKTEAAFSYMAKLGIDSNSLISNFDSNADFSLEAAHLQVDTSYEACRSRDAVLRPFLQGVYWNRKKEFELLRNLLFRPFLPHWAPYAEKYPFVFDYEWLCRLPQFGIIFAGDLLFTDGLNHFLAVEVKDLQPSALKLTGSHTTSRRRNRKKVKLQGVRSAMLWHHQNPQVLTTEVVLVTSGGVDNALSVEYTGVLSRE